MGESNRQKKFSRLVQKELSEILQMDVVVPGSPMLTVSVVRSSPDLGSCKIYISVFPDAQRTNALNWLRENEWDVRQKLAKRVRHQVKFVPEIHFFPDDSLEEVEHMEKLFDQIKKTEHRDQEEE